MDQRQVLSPEQMVNIAIVVGTKNVKLASLFLASTYCTREYSVTKPPAMRYVASLLSSDAPLIVVNVAKRPQSGTSQTYINLGVNQDLFLRIVSFSIGQILFINGCIP